jgi:SnoaL-like protein
MVERSPEIEQVLRENMDAMERSDIEAIERRTSRDECVVGIGSDPSEWGEGVHELLRLVRDSMPDATLQVHSGLDDVRAFREGSVGWAAGRGWFDVEGQRVPVRLTAVLHQEDGDWKFVQMHASIGVPNEHMFAPMLQGRGVS